MFYWLKQLSKNFLINFDNNPWKTYSILIIFSNFIFLFNPEFVLLLSLLSIFCYVFLMIVNSIFLDFKKNRSLIKDKLFFNLDDLISNWKIFKEVNYLINEKVLFLHSLILNWFNSHLFYTCVEILPNHNYALLVLPRFIAVYKKKKKRFMFRLDLECEEQKDVFIYDFL